MFTNPVKERDERTVYIHDVEPDILRSVVAYIYTGSIKLTNENVQEVLVTASMFQLEQLLRHCSCYMAKEICLTNCLEIFMFSSHYACFELKESAKEYILDHFTDIVADSDDIQNLDFEGLRDIISSDDLWVDREEIVYDTIVKWTTNGERTSYFPELFKHIRLSLLDENFVNERVVTNPLVINDRNCSRMLKKYDTYRTKSSPMLGIEDSADSTVVGLNLQPRHGMYNRTMIIFSSGANGKDERSLTAFDPRSMKNYTGVKPHNTFDFKFKVDHFKMVSLRGNRLYFIGGIFYNDHHFEDNSSALKDVYQYNMKEIRWDKKTSMNIGRCCFSTAIYGNAIYVLGGKPTHPRGEATDSVEFYDIDLDIWTETSPLPIKMYHHASAASHDAIFVFGGKDEDDEMLDTVFRYQIATANWTLVTTQMSKPRVQLSAFYFRSNFYLIGGESLHENIVTVNIYDPHQNKWKFGQDFPEERKIRHATFNDGTIYVCGGVRFLGVSGRRSRKVESRDLYKYDIARDTWSKEVKLVQYGNTESIAVAVLNTKYLQESEFISSL